MPEIATEKGGAWAWSVRCRLRVLVRQHPPFTTDDFGRRGRPAVAAERRASRFSGFHVGCSMFGGKTFVAEWSPGQRHLRPNSSRNGGPHLVTISASSIGRFFARTPAPNFLPPNTLTLTWNPENATPGCDGWPASTPKVIGREQGVLPNDDSTLRSAPPLICGNVKRARMTGPPPCCPARAHDRFGHVAAV